MKLNLRNESERSPDKIHRRLLPFYMRPTVLVAFVAISLVGQIVWITAVTIIGEINVWWCSFGFAFGIVLGYIHGKWIARMWARDYLRVLKREITFWQAKGGKGTTIFVIFALGAPLFFCGVHETVFRRVGWIAIIHLRFYRRDEFRGLFVGATVAEIGADIQRYNDSHLMRANLAYQILSCRILPVRTIMH